MERFLSVDGFGDVSEEHFESGLVLAENYFSKHKLDFIECFQAYEVDEQSKLGKHWLRAEREANLALYAHGLQDNSMLELEVVDKKNN